MHYRAEFMYDGNSLGSDVKILIIIVFKFFFIFVFFFGGGGSNLVYRHIMYAIYRSIIR